MRQVAAKAGVSVATVSAVITGKRPVSDALREQVHRAMRELDYHPNALARSLFSGKTKTIAFLVPAVSNPGFAKALHAVESEAYSRGYAVLVANTEGVIDRATSIARRLIEMRVDGVLVALTWELARPPLLELLLRNRVEVVGLSGGRPVPGIDCFLGDEKQAGYSLGRYLAGLGHQECAFIGPRDSAVCQLRLEGIRDGLAAFGGGIPEESVGLVDAYDHQASRECVLTLLGYGTQPSAIVAFNDLMAIGVVSALGGQGIRVPEMVSVAAFGDHYACMTSPQLTTMVYNESEAGHLSAARLLDRIDGIYHREPTACLLPLSLSIRESTRVVAR
jgi:LacI family transcriptional regulator